MADRPIRRTTKVHAEELTEGHVVLVPASGLELPVQEVRRLYAEEADSWPRLPLVIREYAGADGVATVSAWVAVCTSWGWAAWPPDQVVEVLEPITNPQEALELEQAGPVSTGAFASYNRRRLELAAGHALEAMDAMTAAWDASLVARKAERAASGRIGDEQTDRRAMLGEVLKLAAAALELRRWLEAP